MKKRLRAVLALILIILLCLPAIAQTADPDALCALTIDCHYENKPVSGMGFSLYRVAALSLQGEHTLLPAYEDSGIVLGTCGMPPTGGRRPGCWTNGWSSKAFPQKSSLPPRLMAKLH